VSKDAFEKYAMKKKDHLQAGGSKEREGGR
jgi:hypothetical protein